MYVTQADTLTGATAKSAGKKGLVPAPAAGDQGKWLRGDGTWAAVTPSGIGAAASSHEHSAADITSGKLNTERLWTVSTASSVLQYAQDGIGAVFVVNADALADAYVIISQMFAPLASPTFTGAPKAPTASAGTSTEQIATTAFVSAAITAAGGAARAVNTLGSWTVVRITSAYALLLSQVSFTPSGWTEWGRGTQYSNLQPAVSWPVTVKGVIYCDAEVQHDSANSFCDAYLNAAPSLTQFPPFYVTSRSGNTSLETTVTVQRVALVKTA